MKRYLLILAALMPMLCACSSDDGSSYLKTVTGKAGEVIVVLDKANWDGELGSAVRDILATDYPMLPQKEASFTLINIDKRDFSDLFKVHRNIVFFNINPDVSQSGVFVKKDAWAQPQILITVDATSDQQAKELLEQNGETVFNAIDQIEKERIAKASRKYEESSIRSVVAERFGGSPYFPKGYSIKKVTDNFFWASLETTHSNLGILIYTIPFDGVQFPELDYLVEEQKKVLQENVPGMFPNTYMTIYKGITYDGQEAPVMKSYKYKGESFVEIRGLWEVENDFMGGPFVEHVMYAQEKGKLLVVQGFVYAPKFKKRNLLRQVESIVYSFEWAENFQNK